MAGWALLSQVGAPNPLARFLGTLKVLESSLACKSFGHATPSLNCLWGLGQLVNRGCSRCGAPAAGFIWSYLKSKLPCWLSNIPELCGNSTAARPGLLLRWAHPSRALAWGVQNAAHPIRTVQEDRGLGALRGFLHLPGCAGLSTAQ